MLQPNPALTVLFVKEFEWCKLKPAESVAIVAEPDSPEHYLVESLASVAAPFQIMLPVRPEQDHVPVVARGTGGSTVLGLFPRVVELLRKTGMIVDLTVEGLIHSAETEPILKGGGGCSSSRSRLTRWRGSCPRRSGPAGSTGRWSSSRVPGR